MQANNIKIDYKDFKKALKKEDHVYKSETVRRKLFFKGGSDLIPKK